MARTHGKNVDFSFDGQAIEGDLTNVSYTFDIPEAEVTSFTDVYGNFLAGKTNVTATVSGTFNTAANRADEQLFEAIGGGVVTSLFDVTGGGPDTNDPVYTCTASGLSGALVTSYSASFPAGGAATFSASIQNSGATTRAVS